MTKTITIVSPTGMNISIGEDVAHKHNLKNYQRITSEKECARIVADNCRERIAECQLAVAINQFNKQNEND